MWSAARPIFLRVQSPSEPRGAWVQVKKRDDGVRCTETYTSDAVFKVQVVQVGPDDKRGGRRSQGYFARGSLALFDESEEEDAVSGQQCPILLSFFQEVIQVVQVGPEEWSPVSHSVKFFHKGTRWLGNRKGRFETYWDR